MLHGVYANQPSFRPVEFIQGLNLIIAERTDTSTKKDTTNGLGKTTLVEIIDFCLGSTGTRLRIDPLRDWSFSLDLTVAGNRVKATRYIADPNRITIEGVTTGWIEQPDEDKDTGESFVGLSKWKRILGWALFKMPLFEDAQKYKPSYRSLISYFIRTGLDAYADPFRHNRQQKTWDIQLNVAFLLRLNWEYAAKWQELKDQEQALKALDHAIKTGAVEEALGSVGELEAESVRLETQVEVEQNALASFKVLPQYKEVQQEADQTTADIHALANENVIDRRLLRRYMESITAEEAPSDGSIEELYKETGLTFPDNVRKTLSESKNFHNKIIENRKSFLEMEIGRLERQVQERDHRIAELTMTRAGSLEILQTQGALQEMTKLRDKHEETKGDLERIRARISEIKNIKSRKREVKTARTELTKIAERDYEDRRDSWAIPVRMFDENSQALYKTPGRLIIDITDAGYKYDAQFEKSDSEGIGKMKVFCFDLTLIQLMNRQTRGLEFLVHDSMLYDGVDSRQRALALERAAFVSEELGTQYICTMNADMVPRDDFTPGFNIDEYVRLRLTDKDPAGSLLGFQFETPGR
jgi:uncharacterized protein YydD (DUF2326 family)